MNNMKDLVQKGLISFGVVGEGAKAEWKQIAFGAGASAIGIGIGALLYKKYQNHPKVRRLIDRVMRR